MADAYPKDMSGSNWAQVYERQALRAELMPDWFAAVGIKSGERVLEIGAGPGYVSFALAERVGPTGEVIAVERSADALAFLAHLQETRGIAQITRIAADAATVEIPGPPADAALVTYVLHHAQSPEAILRTLHRMLRPGGRALVGEFHPEGPCEIGVKREHRLAPDTVRGWCEAAGFTVLDYLRQTPEHYRMLLARR